MAFTPMEILGYEPRQIFTVKHIIKIAKETIAEENNNPIYQVC